MQGIKDSIKRFSEAEQGVDSDTEQAKYALEFLQKLYKTSDSPNILATFKTMESKTVVCTVCEKDEARCLCNQGYRELKTALSTQSGPGGSTSPAPCSLQDELQLAKSMSEEKEDLESESDKEIEVRLSDEEEEDESSNPDEDELLNLLVVPQSQAESNYPSTASHPEESPRNGDVRPATVAQNVITGRGKKTSFDLPAGGQEDEEEGRFEEPINAESKENESPKSDLIRLVENMDSSGWRNPFDLFSTKCNEEVIYATMLVLMNKLFSRVTDLEEEVRHLREDRDTESSNLLSILQSLDDRMSIIPNQIKSLSGSITEMQNKVLELKTCLDRVDDKIESLSIQAKSRSDDLAKVKVGCPETVFAQNIVKTFANTGFNYLIEKDIANIILASKRGEESLKKTLDMTPLDEKARSAVVTGMTTIRDSYDNPNLLKFWSGIMKKLNTGYTSNLSGKTPRVVAAPPHSAKSMKELAETMKRADENKKESTLDRKTPRPSYSTIGRSQVNSIFDAPEMK